MKRRIVFFIDDDLILIIRLYEFDFFVVDFNCVMNIIKYIFIIDDNSKRKTKFSIFSKIVKNFIC